MMSYLSAGTLENAYGLAEMHSLFVASGWDAVTAVCFIIFALMHWPCSTTLITIKKETGSLKWTFLAAAIPTAIGIALCILVNFTASLLL